MKQNLHNFLILFFICFGTTVWAKVEPPNYNFSLDKFNDFYPNKSLKSIQSQYGPGEIVLRQGPYLTYKFYIAHIRYKFVILVQTRDDKVLDFHARLPHYFLHDVFHQSLINRIGKQDTYLLKDEHAVYVWKNQTGFKHTYEAACTITCFPIYYALELKDHGQSDEYVAIINQMASKELKK